MVIHKCDKCNKEFIRKAHYDVHIKRMNPCKYPTQTPQNPTQTPQNPTQTPQNPTQTPQNPTQTPQNPTQNHSKLVKNNKIVILDSISCCYCLKSFTRVDALIRHKNNYCKMIKESKEDKENIYQELIKQMNDIKEQNKELREELKKIQNKTNSNNTKMKMNSDNIITTNNIQNNIKLCAFGKEDLSHITDEVYKKIFVKGFHSVLEFINKVHFDEKKPEHCNVYISNIRDKYAMIYDGNDWILKNQDNVLSYLLELKKDNLIDKFDGLLEKLSDRTINKFKRFLDKEDDDEVINSIKQDIKLLLYNKKKIPLKLKRVLDNDVKQIVI
jgi:hypothetical protein